MRLDERERPSFAKEVAVSSSSPFMRTGGKPRFHLRKITLLFSIRHLKNFQIRSKREINAKLEVG